MGIVPKDKSKRITWYKTRVAKWAEDPQAIGSTPEQVAEVQAIVEEARLARIEQYRAQQAAQSATLRYNQTMKRLSKSGAAVLLQVRAHAAADPAVYSKASIPAPRKKSRLPEPGQPSDLRFSIDAVGWLTLTWKCDNPANATGTTYFVSRQLNGAGPFVHLGNIGKKKCIDRTLPAGARSVAYQVQAVRTAAVSEVARLYVNLGSATRAGMGPPTKWDLRGGPGRAAA